MSTSPYTFVANALQFANLCQAYVEQQILGRTGVYPSAIAAASAPDFVHTSDAASIPAGVEVVFSAALSNDGYGHSGVSLGNGQMRSVWSNGNVEDESIALFASDNNAPLLGYTALGRNVAAQQTGGQSSAPSAQNAATGILDALRAHPAWVAWGVAALVAWELV